MTLDEGLARFDCTIHREVEAGDHTIVLLRLHAVEHSDTSLPLVFHRSAFGPINDAHVTGAPADPRPVRPVADAPPRRVALASAVGATIEWYDFFLYGTAAGLVFDKLFFNGLDGPAAQFAAFGTFAVGFLARPVGGLVFGHFGDRIGRKKMLLLTLLIMGVGTAAIGLLPSYDRDRRVGTGGCSSRCGCSRASASAASTAAPCCSRSSTRRPSGGASSEASPTSASPADYCSLLGRSSLGACCPTTRSSPGDGAPASSSASRCSGSVPTSGSR